MSALFKMTGPSFHVSTHFKMFGGIVRFLRNRDFLPWTLLASGVVNTVSVYYILRHRPLFVARGHFYCHFAQVISSWALLLCQVCMVRRIRETNRRIDGLLDQVLHYLNVINAIINQQALAA